MNATISTKFNPGQEVFKVEPDLPFNEDKCPACKGKKHNKNWSGMKHPCTMCRGSGIVGGTFTATVEGPFKIRGILVISDKPGDYVYRFEADEYREDEPEGWEWAEEELYTTREEAQAVADSGNKQNENKH